MENVHFFIHCHYFKIFKRKLTKKSAFVVNTPNKKISLMEKMHLFIWTYTSTLFSKMNFDGFFYHIDCVVEFWKFSLSYFLLLKKMFIGNPFKQEKTKQNPFFSSQFCLGVPFFQKLFLKFSLAPPHFLSSKNETILDWLLKKKVPTNWSNIFINELFSFQNEKP